MTTESKVLRIQKQCMVYSSWISQSNIYSEMTELTFLVPVTLVPGFWVAIDLMRREFPAFIWEREGESIPRLPQIPTASMDSLSLSLPPCYYLYLVDGFRARRRGAWILTWTRVFSWLGGSPARIHVSGWERNGNTACVEAGPTVLINKERILEI